MDNKLLEFANTEAGRYLLGIKDGFPVVKVSPNSTHQLVDVVKGKPIIIGRFYTSNKVQQILEAPFLKYDIADEYRKIEEDKYKALLHFAGLESNRYLPQVYLTTDTFTANGGGQGRVGGSNATYSTIHDSVSETAGSGVTRPTNATGFEIQRGFAPFDTSTIGAGATVIEGANTFIRCYVTGTDDNDSDSVSVVESTQASNTALVNADYDQVGTTKFITDVLISNVTTAGAPGSANDFQLNSNGVSHIKVSAYTLFAWRTAKDIAVIAPTVGNNNIQMVDDTNLLSVEYTVASAGGSFLLNFV